MANDDVKYDNELQREDERRMSPGSAAILLQQWIGFNIRLERARVQNLVAVVDGLLARVESRAMQLGWLDEDNEPSVDEMPVDD